MTTKEIILDMLTLSRGKPVSGAAMAEKAEISFLL